LLRLGGGRRWMSPSAQPVRDEAPSAAIEALAMRTYGSPYGDRSPGSGFFGGMAPTGTRPPSRTSHPRPWGGRTPARQCPRNTATGRSRPFSWRGPGRRCRPRSVYGPDHGLSLSRTPCRRQATECAGHSGSAPVDLAISLTEPSRVDGPDGAGPVCATPSRCVCFNVLRGFQRLRVVFGEPAGVLWCLSVILGTSRGIFWPGQRLDHRQAPQKLLSPRSMRSRHRHRRDAHRPDDGLAKRCSA